MLGLGWHALLGRRLWQLPLYWLGGVLGFLGGVVVSSLAGFGLYRVGTVPVVEGTVGALLALGALWLFTTPAGPPGPRRSVQRGQRDVGGSRGKG
jgi:hypothetical protein